MNKLVLFFICIIISQSVFSQWILDYQFNPPNSKGISYISVTDTNYLWFVTYESQLISQVYKKSGTTVSLVETNNITRPNKIIAVDTSNAYLNAFDGRLYYTSNSGANWLVRLDSTFLGYFFDVSTTDPNVIVAGAYMLDSNINKVYISTNSGSNWTLQNINFSIDRNLYDIAITDPQHLWLGINCEESNCTYLNYMYSTNGGTNWSSKEFPLVSNNTSILAPVFDNDNMTGFTFAIGFNIYRYRTDNGGLNWTPPEYFSLGNTEGMHGIKNVPGSHIWLCATADKVWKSVNNGINWAEMSISLNDSDKIGFFDVIRKGNKYYGYLGTTRGAIYKVVEDVPPIGIEPISNEIPIFFKLHQNYPNPFNPVTKLKFEIPKAGFVSIEVFDLLGRVVSNIVNENLTAGIYETDFDAANLPSGIYYYRISTVGFTETKKMVLVK